jgi:hypothetical protein
VEVIKSESVEVVAEVPLLMRTMRALRNRKEADCALKHCLNLYVCDLLTASSLICECWFDQASQVRERVEQNDAAVAD